MNIKRNYSQAHHDTTEGVSFTASNTSYDLVFSEQYVTKQPREQLLKSLDALKKTNVSQDDMNIIAQNLVQAINQAFPRVTQMLLLQLDQILQSQNKTLSKLQKTYSEITYEIDCQREIIKDTNRGQAQRMQKVKQIQDKFRAFLAGESPIESDIRSNLHQITQNRILLLKPLQSEIFTLNDQFEQLKNQQQQTESEFADLKQTNETTLKHLNAVLMKTNNNSESIQEHRQVLITQNALIKQLQQQHSTLRAQENYQCRMNRMISTNYQTKLSQLKTENQIITEQGQRQFEEDEKQRSYVLQEVEMYSQANEAGLIVAIDQFTNTLNKTNKLLHTQNHNEMQKRINIANNQELIVKLELQQKQTLRKLQNNAFNEMEPTVNFQTEQIKLLERKLVKK
ncbi:Hypothetical_protein [Hexamita inflata]|uniref:Hypothetical_protein n=1 Tax=Hexamita inflata TaxID=28002 RepID=A0AA86UJX1_9EUKA|nr:Hypothetical protein HINF_LOCUS41926 [Hexamita inflata]